MPPPTVTIQTGHWADTGETRNKKLETRKEKKETKNIIININYFTLLNK